MNKKIIYIEMGGMNLIFPLDKLIYAGRVSRYNIKIVLDQGGEGAILDFNYYEDAALCLKDFERLQDAIRF